MKFIIPGRMPGLNEYISAERSNRYKAAAMKRQQEERVLLAIRQQLPNAHLRRVWLHYLFVEPNRRRDKDNISGFAHKVIQDALVKSGLLPNDGWDEIAGYDDIFAVDKSEPKIIVRVETLHPEREEPNG